MRPVSGLKLLGFQSLAPEAVGQMFRHGLAELGLLLRIQDRTARFEIDAARGIDGPERIRGQHGAGVPFDHIHIAVSIDMDEHLLHLAVERHVEQDLLVDAVIVVLIVRGILVVPTRRAGRGVARKDARRPFVVARALKSDSRVRDCRCRRRAHRARHRR